MAALALALLTGGCASSAPHGAAAMAINTGLAVGVAAAERSAGGCWAMCTDGLVCNPASGWCEKPPPAAVQCPPGVSGTDPRCTSWPAPTIKQTVPSTGGGAGISPATGRAPLQPWETSPGGPPRP